MELHVLHQHGWSVSALARHFNVNRRTVARELEAVSRASIRTECRCTRFTAAQLAHIERRLAVCPVIHSTDLHRECQRSGKTGQ